MPKAKHVAKPAAKNAAKTTALAAPRAAAAVEVMYSRGSLVPASTAERWEYARQNIAGSISSAIAAGRALLALKDSLPHGEFAEGREQHLKGISERACQSYMTLARRFGERERELSCLGTNKLLALAEAGFSGEDYNAGEQTIAGQTLDEIAQLTSRELREKLRVANKRLEKQAKEIMKAEGTIADLEKQAHPRPSSLDDVELISAGVKRHAIPALMGFNNIDFSRAEEQVLCEALSTLGMFIAAGVETLGKIHDQTPFAQDAKVHFPVTDEMVALFEALDLTMEIVTARAAGRAGAEGAVA